MGTKAEKGFQQEPGSSPSLLLAPTFSDPPASKGATSGPVSSFRAQLQPHPHAHPKGLLGPPADISLSFFPTL